MEAGLPMLNIAVVTPYYKEPAEQLLQCHNSVLKQTYPCTHLLVADGFPREVSTPKRTLHVQLPKGNADYGNTPRMIGGLLADSYGFDAVAYLDADNWYAREHLAKLVEAQQSTGAPLVSCKRTFCDIEGRVLPVTEPEEDKFQHVDTNCWLIMRPAFPLFYRWRIPKPAAVIGDRVFFQNAQRERYQITETHHRTVFYRTKYPDHYKRANVPMPEGAYETDEVLKAYAYLMTLPGAIEMTSMVGFFPKF
ncbi:MAG: hypothetical protein P4L54_06655 [Acidocella sp.]|nr:hypothetical protein [Acidocella sp.]